MSARVLQLSVHEGISIDSRKKERWLSFKGQEKESSFPFGEEETQGSFLRKGYGGYLPIRHGARENRKSIKHEEMEEPGVPRGRSGRSVQ